MAKRIVATTLFIILISSLWNTCIAAQKDVQQLDFITIDEYIKRQMDEGKIPGLALGIVKGDSIVYLKGYGNAGQNREVNEKTPFAIGSVGKTFTALAVRQLINEGEIDEYASIQEYIKEFKPIFQGEVAEITVNQLLTHTSGLSTKSGNELYLYNSKYSLAELVEKAANTNLNRPVGSSYEYSNLNYLVLGLIVEKVTGMSYETYVENNIFKELDMNKSYLDESKAVENGMADGHNYVLGFNLTTHYPFPKGIGPAGGYFSTIEDMSHYLICYLNKGYYNGNSIIPNNSLKAAVDPLADSYKDYWYTEYWLENAGYPIADLYLNYYGHNGSLPNYSSSIYLNQKSRYGIVVLANSRDQAKFFKTEIAPWTISKGIMEYVETGKLPPDTIVKGSYERIIWVVLALVLILSYAIVSIRRFIHVKNKKIGALLLLSSIFVDYILPILAFIIIPVYNDVSWGWLLASNPELDYLIITLIVLLIGIGIIKTIIYICIRYKKYHEQIARADS